MQLLGEARGMLAFLFTPDADLVVEDDARPGADGADVLDGAIVALQPLTDWTTAAIEAALRSELLDARGMKPRTAFGPLRAAISGRRISPPLFESLELLGRDSSLARIRALRATL